MSSIDGFRPLQPPDLPALEDRDEQPAGTATPAPPPAGRTAGGGGRMALLSALGQAPGTAPAAGVAAAAGDRRGAGLPAARIAAFSSPFTNASGLVDFKWDKPGDTIPFEMTVELAGGDPGRVKAEVWTNADRNEAPHDYRAVPMRLAGFDGKRATYRVDLPVEKIGNYRAIGRISVDGGKTFSWMGDQGVNDIRFRPRDEAHDALNFMEVNVANVNFDPATKRPGTFADMMESGSPLTNGKYTLEWLASQGKTAIWLMPPFEVSKWDRRHPADDAGSPYAVKDYFSIRTELSTNARGLTGEAAREAALAEFKAFVEKAHSLGIKVVLDVALNHVGHNYEFRDLFVRYDEAGREVREVRKDDFSNVVVSPDQLEVVKKRLADPSVPDYMEYLAPWMYGSKSMGPEGARSPEDKAPGGWFEWPDTAQLNHRRRREGYSWWDTEPSAETRAVQGWLGRIMRFWAVDMNVDGFRLDHLTGLPLDILEESANLAQADVDEHQPGKHLFLMGEDFHTSADTRHWLDAGQGGWFHEFLKARTPEDLERIVEHPWFHDLKNLSSHDEERFINHFGEDTRAAARLACLLQLFGGPVAEVAGDDIGERAKLPFKQYAGLTAMVRSGEDGARMAAALGSAGRARQAVPALEDDNRRWLRPKTGGPDPDLLALSRYPDAKDGEVVLVFANLGNERTRENAFSLDEETRRRIDPAKRYQVRDLMAGDPTAPVWAEPVSGRTLLEQGIFARLEPYRIQALKLEAVG